MDFRDTPDEARFRRELRSWLRKHAPRRPPAGGGALDPDEEWAGLVDWHRRLYEGGWIGLSWPKEYGGRGATLMEQIIFNEELSRRALPPGCNVLGVLMAGPAIMRWGTEQQKRRHLHRILAGDEIWCEGLSEPHAGSDLASLATRAAPDGDDYIVNGQKVWTTLAHRAHWMQLFVRTDAAARRHQGVSCILADMRSPGITVRPLRQMTGEAHFNEVFFDDVRVPRSSLLGPLHGGWKVLITTLMHERAGIGEVGSEGVLAPLVALARSVERDGRPASKDGWVRQELARFAIEAEAHRLSALRSLTRRLRGEQPGPEGSIGKLAASELAQRMARFAIDLTGERGLEEGTSPDALYAGRWLREILAAPSLTIAGGTSEVQRNIIGERILRLPKS